MAQTGQHARFQPSETVDFVIVGSGAAGGIIAKELSTAGFSVVVLEQGPRLTESQFDHDEFGTFTQSHNCNDPVTQPQTFRATPHDKAKKALSLIYGRLVGGSNAHFTGNFWRLRPSDFNEASVLGWMKGTGLADWPITYEELEPYYTKAEWELGVSGEPGPFDPPRSRPYPMPPLPVKSSGVLLQRARAVVLCANGAETPRLLLNSESSRFPHGLANSSGLVGKYLMFNTYFGVNAQFEHPLNEFKSVQNTRMVLDFYETDPRRGFYGGGGVGARVGENTINFPLEGVPPGSPGRGGSVGR